MSHKVDAQTFGIFVLVWWALFALIGAFCWPYAINEWLVYFGRPPKVEMWQGAILGMIPYIGRFSLAVAVLTWAIMLIIG